MAIHTTMRFSCDRCGTDLGPERGEQEITITASKAGEWAMEWTAEWNDLCPKCKMVIDEFFSRRTKEHE